jgi:hypothetical protein
MQKEKTLQNLYWSAFVSHSSVSDIYFGFIIGILLIMMFYIFRYDRNMDRRSSVYALHNTNNAITVAA